MIPPTPRPVYLVVPMPLPVHVADSVNIWLAYVLPSISSVAAVVAGYYAVRTGQAALNALRKPELVIQPSYRSSDGHNQIERTSDGNVAITFVLINFEVSRATDAKVRFKIEGVESAAIGSIRLDLSGEGEVVVGTVSPRDAPTIGTIVGNVDPGKYNVQWQIVCNEGRWPHDGTYSTEEVVVIANHAAGSPPQNP